MLPVGMNTAPPRLPVDLCRRCGSAQVAPNSCPCPDASAAQEYRRALGASRGETRAISLLAVIGCFSLGGGCIGVLSDDSHPIALSGLAAGVHGFIGATLGFALGTAIALWVHFSNRPSR